MRLALALVLAIIATVHNAGASAQKTTPELRTLSGEWTFAAEGYVMPLSLRQDGTKMDGDPRRIPRFVSVARRIQEGADSFCGLLGRRWNPAQRRLK